MPDESSPIYGRLDKPAPVLRYTEHLLLEYPCPPRPVPLADVARLIWVVGQGGIGVIAWIILLAPCYGGLWLLMALAHTPEAFPWWAGLLTAGAAGTVGRFVYLDWRVLRQGLWARGTIQAVLQPPIAAAPPRPTGDDSTRPLAADTLREARAQRARIRWQVHLCLTDGTQLDRVLPQWGQDPDSVRVGDQVDVLLTADGTRIWAVLDYCTVLVPVSA